MFLQLNKLSLKLQEKEGREGRRGERKRERGKGKVRRGTVKAGDLRKKAVIGPSWVSCL